MRNWRIELNKEVNGRVRHLGHCNLLFDGFEWMSCNDSIGISMQSSQHSREFNTRRSANRITTSRGAALARPPDLSHILGTMREILPGIFMWGSTYADMPWDLNGYAIRFDGYTVLVDPPEPGEDDWPIFDAMKPIAKIILTNRDHVRDAKLFQTRYGARLGAGADEVSQLAPFVIDETVREGDLIAGALRVIHLPGKSAGEIGLYFDPAHHAVSREMGGILLLGDAIIGNPPGALSLIPEAKLDDPAKLKRSLPKLLDYDFDVCCCATANQC